MRKQNYYSHVFRFSVIGSVVILLAGCANTQNYRVAVKSWEGANVRALYKVWGYPDATQKMPEGHRLLVYRYRNRGMYPTYTVPGVTSVNVQNGNTQVYTTSGYTSGGGLYDLRCTTWFEVNDYNRIVVATFRGNACVGSNNFVKTHSNQGGRMFIKE